MMRAKLLFIYHTDSYDLSTDWHRFISLEYLVEFIHQLNPTGSTTFGFLFFPLFHDFSKQEMD